MKCYKNRAFIKNKSVISNNSNKVLLMQWNSFLELSKMAAREKEFCQFISNSHSLSLSLSHVTSNLKRLEANLLKTHLKCFCRNEKNTPAWNCHNEMAYFHFTNSVSFYSYVSLPLYLSISLYAYLSLFLFLYSLSILMSVCLTFHLMSVCLMLYLSIYLSLFIA